MEPITYLTISYFNKNKIVSIDPNNGDELSLLYVVEILRQYLSTPQIDQVIESDDFIHGFKVLREDNLITLYQRVIEINKGWIWNSESVVDNKLASIELCSYEQDISPEEFVELFKDNKEELEASKLMQSAVIAKEFNKEEEYKKIIEELKTKLPKRV